MLNAFAVFVPWALLGLLVSLIVAASALVSRVRSWAAFRRSFRAAVRGNVRRYSTTFINHRGF